MSLSTSKDGVDAALDRLADMGMTRLMRDVVEPVCAAMMEQASAELGTQDGTKRFFADYWSMSRAIASAFDSPEMATRLSTMFFARAPVICSAWVGSENVEGRKRLRLEDLKPLVEAACAVKDKNSRCFVTELVEAMVARQSESVASAMDAALNSEPRRTPVAFAALCKELSNSFIWPVDVSLDARIDSLCEEAQASGKISSDSWMATLEEFESVGMARGNHGLSSGFAIKLASRAAREPKAMGLSSEQWSQLMDRLLDWAESARQQSKEHLQGVSKGLSAFDEKMLAGWGAFIGGARERLVSELALGALERAAERDSEDASLRVLEFMREMFWGRGQELGPKSSEKLKSMACAMCNRLARDGAVSCFSPQAAQALHHGMITSRPAPAVIWSAAIDPRTLAWQMQVNPSPVTGSQWRQLAGMVCRDQIDALRQARWIELIESGTLSFDSSEESMRDAVSAKDLAKSCGAGHALGAAIVKTLNQALVPDGDSQERLQDLLGSLSDLGATDAACERAGNAMSEALAILERASLESAMAPEQERGAAQRKTSPRL